MSHVINYDALREDELAEMFDEQLGVICAAKNPYGQGAARDFAAVASAILARENAVMRTECIKKIDDKEIELERKIQYLPETVESWRNIYLTNERRVVYS